MSHSLFPRVFGGAPRHELHHQHGHVYFHQFFMWIDDLAGFTLPAEKAPKTAPANDEEAERLAAVLEEVGGEGMPVPRAENEPAVWEGP